MSTKATIKYDSGQFHLYFDTTDDPIGRPVHLEMYGGCADCCEVSMLDRPTYLHVKIPHDVAVKLGLIKKGQS